MTNALGRKLGDGVDGVDAVEMATTEAPLTDRPVDVISPEPTLEPRPCEGLGITVVVLPRLPVGRPTTESRPRRLLALPPGVIAEPCGP